MDVCGLSYAIGKAMPWLSANLHRALAVAVIATASVLSSPAGVQAAPRVVVTVDVESNDSFPLPRQAEAVCKDGSACGLMEVARLLRTRGLAGTFFLNVYEYPRWGESAIRDIAVKLQAAGQDVALHTHPETMYDASRPWMYQYSLD